MSAPFGAFLFMGDSAVRNKGFTLVELLVVVIIIGILAAISLANYVSASKKAKNASIRSCMRTIQITSENYATDSGGRYSTTAAGPFLNYLPGGSNNPFGSAGIMPANPLTGQAGSISDAGIATSKALVTLRSKAPTGATASAGNTSYSQVDSGDSYAVTGSDVDGTYISNSGGGTLVLSNQ